MAEPYLPLPLDANLQNLLDAAVARIRARFPAYRSDEVALASAILEEGARLQVNTRIVVTRGGDLHYMTFGEKFLRTVRKPAVAAVLPVTVTMRDDAGYTVPAHRQVSLDAGGGRVVAYEFAADFTVDPGDTEGDTELVAVVAGAAGNGLGPGATTMWDTPGYVLSVTATAASAGGVDGETDAAYLNRIYERSRLLHIAAIKAADFAVLARDIAGVHRALGIDDYDPGPPADDEAERSVSVALVDGAGAEVAAPVEAEVTAYLQGFRETGFQVFIIPPTYTDVAIDFEFEPKAGYDGEAVRVAAVAAGSAHITPATWGGGNQVLPVWLDEPVVHYLDVARILGSVDGVHHLTALTLNGGDADVALAGPAGLPSPIGPGGSSVTGSGRVTRPDVALATEEYYAALGEGITAPDEDTGWSLLAWLDGLGHLDEDVQQLVGGRDGRPAWAVVYDPDACPAWALPWAGQHVGEQLAGLDEATARDRYANPAGFKRGMPDTIVAAVAATLIGGRTVQLLERDTSAYHHTIKVYAAEMPDQAATEAAIARTKASGDRFTLDVLPGQTWAELIAGYATWADVIAAYPTWQDVIEDIP